MIRIEVNFMEDERINEPIENEEEHYEPRPLRQVWAARVGLVVFLIFVIYQILTIATGGL
jgi:hypothetical protein